MGGNAFPKLNIRRIGREEIPSTLNHLVKTINYPGLTYEYVMGNLMGSAMKQQDSGDVDIAINNIDNGLIENGRSFVLHPRVFALHCHRLVNLEHINSKYIKSNQVQLAWPILGDPENGFAQIDFIFGDPDWLKFTHHSPGKDESPWKGVMISTLLGVIVKQNIDFSLVCEDQIVAKVGLYYGLEKGIYRKWSILKKGNTYCSEVDPDTFETKIRNSPRFSRLGYITDPEVALRMIFHADVKKEDVSTFEKLVMAARIFYPDSFQHIKGQFLSAFRRSAATNSYSFEEIENLDLWST